MTTIDVEPRQGVKKSALLPGFGRVEVLPASADYLTDLNLYDSRRTQMSRSPLSVERVIQAISDTEQEYRDGPRTRDHFTATRRREVTVALTTPGYAGQDVYLEDATMDNIEQRSSGYVIPGNYPERGHGRVPVDLFVKVPDALTALARVTIPDGVEYSKDLGAGDVTFAFDAKRRIHAEVSGKTIDFGSPANFRALARRLTAKP